MLDGFVKESLVKVVLSYMADGKKINVPLLKDHLAMYIKSYNNVYPV